MNIDQAKEMAYRSRQDYQGLQAQVRAAQLQRKAAKWERLPTLDFQGNYGVTGVTGGLYHGTFVGCGIAQPALVSRGQISRRQWGRGHKPDQSDPAVGCSEGADQPPVADSILDVQTATELVRVDAAT